MKNRNKKFLTKEQEIKKDYKIITTIIHVIYSLSFLLFLNINIFTMIIFGILSITAFIAIASFKMAEAYELMLLEERIC